MLLVTIIFWLQAFASPFLISIGIGFIITSEVSIVSLVIGGILGTVFAEYIRRKFSLDVFFGRLYGPNEMDEKLKKKDKI